MGEGQDRQDAVEGVNVPGGPPPAEPAAAASDSPTTGGSATEALFADDAGLTGAIASLEAPEPPLVAQGTGAATAESAPATVPAEVAPDASGAAEVNPEIQAPQADLEAAANSEIAESEPAASDAGAQTGAATETSESLDDIAPGTVGGEQAAIEDAGDIGLPDDRSGVPIWPFIVYFAAWVVFAALLVWQFMQTPAGMPLYELTIYGPSILVGLVLTVLGPLVAIAVWLVVWLTRPGARAGLFSRCLILGAVATLGGVAVWLVALGVVDMLRLGRLL
jgi:hypothetical protein